MERQDEVGARGQGPGDGGQGPGPGGSRTEIPDARPPTPIVDYALAPDARPPIPIVEETIETLRQQMDAARTENEEQLRGWQRTQADFVNFRRRVEQERAELVKSAESGLIRDLLPVVDDLDRAVSSLPPEMLRLTWVEGILLIQRKLEAVLELYGLKPIEALGKEFDPHEHDAVLRDGEPEEATVVTAELQKGYRLHDWVLRPTLVKVGPPANSTAG